MPKHAEQLALHGGKPIRSAPWPTYDKGDVEIEEEDIQAAITTLRKKLYFRYDYRSYEETATGRYENLLRAHFQTKHALAVSSGTAAIVLGLLACDLKPGSLVACPAFTFPATPSAILLAKCIPVVIEVDEDLNLDLNDLRKKYTPEMKAIVPVHMRGMCPDMEEVMKFAREKDLMVVEDAVSTCGVSLRKQKLGTFGHVGAFSSQSDKTLNTGEGGFLITNDDEIYAKAVAYSGAFIPCFYKHFKTPPSISPLDYPLYNFRIDEIRSDLAASQMLKLDKRINEQYELYENITQQLNPLPEIKIRKPIDKRANLGKSLIFHIHDTTPALTSWFVEALKAEGIEASTFTNAENVNVRVYWNWRFLYKNISLENIQKTLPQSYRYISRSIDIPLSVCIGKQGQTDLIDAFKKIVNDPTFKSMRRS